VIKAAESVLDQWGRVDVLVNNGRYIGPGHMDQILETPLELLDLHLEANVMAPLALIKTLVPGMIDRGAGWVINITSGAGYHDPPAAAGNGGWGLGYGMSKGAMHRIAGILQLETGDRGIHAYNVQPGFIATERMFQDMAEFGFDASAGAPPDVIGAVVAWIVGDTAAADARAEPDGRNFEAQDVCRELGLLPGWPA
jgi:NAD(P)-dependent dehydrogenase (short-subunit alcohol dehydrogenase family)